MTGVQTCALPIWRHGHSARAPEVAAINATARVFPVPNWRARQVRGVERGGVVQGI